MAGQFLSHEGMVVALKIDKCSMPPGSCEGTVEMGEPGKARAVRIQPGTTSIKKGGHPVVLQELMLGDTVAVEVAHTEGGESAKLIEVRKERLKHQEHPTGPARGLRQRGGSAVSAFPAGAGFGQASREQGPAIPQQHSPKISLLRRRTAVKDKDGRLTESTVKRR
jgi:hypothetical protein